MKQKAEFWAAHVKAASLVAMPASEYAKQHGLAVKSLYYWRRKLKISDTTGAPLPVGKFVALRIAPGVSQQSNCTLALPSGLRLELSVLPSPDWLAALVRAVPGLR